MNKTIGYGKAHSKIILMGEHSVVYGYPALALPLKDIEVTCRIFPATKPLAFDFYGPLSTAVYAALEHLGCLAEPIHYDIMSQVPQKRGMGSSAAVSIAAVRAVFSYFGKPLSNELLEILVNKAEIIAHTNPSGLDAKTCLSDKAIKFIRNVGFDTIDIHLNAYLVIADTGIQGHTREAVNKVAQFEEENLPHLAKLGCLTEAVEQAIKTNDCLAIGRFMTQAHESLKAIGVSVAKADQLVAAALEAGALGAKMTGGGLGGCMIALAERITDAQQISKKLKEEGAVNTWIQIL
ncbi:TPA: mevalonate kinase [Streptococcus equi subsp. zooepidemicus]|uniref:mevalonate kinase n=1 Tax=Streptococcus equi TaxID=1336 RepID=UPI0013F60CC8|nr:mevalonate kinase [Streptococcus equi]QTR93792.1 Galactokinase [Streptococcus equi subsp. zooepidemicus]HEL0027313.1 mevalonate kinase [Streptococcus equi subsp. zooepidemicus]HEL0028869.1 mevalonate kinase [Streptococcus equi subsp. zooepidemicus]HEL0579266.1 mevalonate kinase [Streptococcus equi subsp. zooepidemicus]HEL0580637.1 mevalonate kinase [Streptococcus equi subsp. zooepidemicus]